MSSADTDILSEEDYDSNTDLSLSATNKDIRKVVTQLQVKR